MRLSTLKEVYTADTSVEWKWKQRQDIKFPILEIRTIITMIDLINKKDNPIVVFHF